MWNSYYFTRNPLKITHIISSLKMTISSVESPWEEKSKQKIWKWWVLKFPVTFSIGNTAKVCNHMDIGFNDCFPLLMKAPGSPWQAELTTIHPSISVTSRSVQGGVFSVFVSFVFCVLRTLPFPGHLTLAVSWPLSFPIFYRPVSFPESSDSHKGSLYDWCYFQLFKYFLWWLKQYYYYFYDFLFIVTFT